MGGFCFLISVFGKGVVWCCFFETLMGGFSVVLNVVSWIGLVGGRVGSSSVFFTRSATPFFSFFFFGYYVGTTEYIHFEEVEFQITGVSVTC